MGTRGEPATVQRGSVRGAKVDQLICVKPGLLARWSGSLVRDVWGAWQSGGNMGSGTRSPGSLNFPSAHLSTHRLSALTSTLQICGGHYMRTGSVKRDSPD